MSLIIEYASISEIYADLLIRLRQIDKANESGEAICRQCKQRKKTHLSDGRCSISALSREFVDSETEERAKIMRALEIIEELKQL